MFHNRSELYNQGYDKNLIFSGLQESTKTAPYSSLPHRYTDAPTSFHALNTYVKEANVIKRRKKKKAGKDKFEADINSIKVGEIHGISTTKPPSKSEEESKKVSSLAKKSLLPVILQIFLQE